MNPRLLASSAHRTQLERIRALLHAHELDAYAPLIEARLTVGIGLRTRVATVDDLAIGATRFGGEPDAPPDFRWPDDAELPCHFVAQLRLDALAPLDLDRRLPTHGLLSIFAADAGWPVHAHLFSDEPAALVRHPRPPALQALLDGPYPFKFRATGVDVEAQVHLPDVVTWPADGPLTPRDADDRYWHVADARATDLFGCAPIAGAPGRPSVHRVLGGLPDELCYVDAPDGAQVEAPMEVVLAYDSDELVGMEWGDAQRVWLVIDRDALAAGELSSLRGAMIP